MVRTTVFKILGITLLANTALALGDKPMVKVSLHPAVTELAPGATFDIGIRFKVPDGAHIYWKNPGDSGLAPTVVWKLPPGFELGQLSFPAPKRHREAADLMTYVLKGEPVLIQSITAPKTLKPNSKVTLAAELRWLVCKKGSCILEQDSISVELPVGRFATKASPADQQVLQYGRRALPIPGEKSKYVKVSPSTTVQSVKPGQSFEVALDVTIAPGHHVQSNQPSLPAFIPTHVFVERDPGLTFSKAQYPPPHERIHPQLGKMSEYRGRIRIKVPAQVEGDVEGAHVRIAGVLTAQACDDKTGTCFPPEHIAWELVLPVERSTVTQPTDSQQREPSGAATEGTATPVPVDEGLGVASGDGDWLAGFLSRLGFPGLLIGCFLYGLLINATPCVLPVLSIKVLGFVQQAHESRARTLVLGLTFGVGVVLFFVILGFVAAAGRNVLQYPVTVIGLGAVVMALSLSMLGVYTLQAPSSAASLEAGIQREGPLASFAKGALAPVLGFACTGPFLAGVFGWATQQPPKIAVFAFLFAGFGMASPYMLLGAFPKWLSFLPKPGQWMITFERIMGFLLLAMVIWLLNPLVTQVGPGGLQWTLVFLVAVGLSCWVLGKIDLTMSAGQRWRYRGVAAAIVAGAGLLIYGWVYPLGQAQAEQRAIRSGSVLSDGVLPGGIRWGVWSAEAVEQAVRSGKTVFVDVTAAYCAECRVNKKVAINTPEVYARMMDLGVVAFRADFSSPDSRIFELLRKHNRLGPPLNLIYPAGKPSQPLVLRPQLTMDYLLEKLDETGPSSSTDEGKMERMEN
ncbi:MAG: thioredoxin family protein [Phycisphaerae bacterium]|nr:thioredoxin family protein [Phycisphaerae bacterium]